MTDTAKPVDLSTLEQGDTVVFKGGQKAIVNHVIECSIDYFTVFLFMINNGRPIHIERDYTKNGACVAFTYNPEIIKIIKNQKRWGDSDMKAAFLGGNEYAVWHGLNCNDWLEQYRVFKNEH